MAEIFVSYSSDDRERVRKIVDALQADGFSVWWDRSILAGTTYDRAIETAINESACVVVVWSVSSIDSEYVRSEVEEAARRNILVPVLIDDVLPPLAHRRRQAARLLQWSGAHDTEYEVLVAGIRATILGANQPQPNATPPIPQLTPTSKNRSILLGFSLVAVAILLIGAIFVFRSPTPTSVQEAQSAPARSITDNASPTQADALVSGNVERSKVLPNSIAVLPFANLSPNTEDAYFAAGMHYEVLNQLAKIRDLNVIARTSVLRYANNQSLSIPEIADELNVEVILEGTVRYAGGRVRITTQLIDAESNTHLWSDTYEDAFVVDNIFAIESNIAERIVEALEAQYLPSERASIEKLSTNSEAALRHYLRARVSIADLGPDMSPEEISAFHGYLDQALEEDPEFALAYALKAYEYSFSTNRSYPNSDPNAIIEREALARRYADRALELDPSLGQAYAALGLTHLYNRRWREAQQSWERAYELSPNDLDVAGDFAWILSVIGRREDSRTVARRAMDLAPNSAQVIMVAGLAFLTLGDYGATVDAQRRAIALDPDLFLPYLLRGIAEVARGNNTIAIELFRQAEKLVQNIPSPDMIGMIAYGYGRAGSAEDAQRMFSRIQAMSTEFHVGSASWTLAHLGIKDLDSARASLRLAGDDWAVDEGFMSLCTLAFNTSSDPILERADIEEARTRLGFR